MKKKPNQIPDEYLIEIGRITVAWSSLELHLSIVMGMALLDRYAPTGDKRPTAIFAHMAFQQKLDALESMLRLVDENAANTYRDKVKGLLKAAQEKRNAVQHHIWFAGEDGVKRREIKARGKLKETVIPVSLTDLRKTASDIRHAAVELVKLTGVDMHRRITRLAEEAGRSKGDS